MLTVVNVHESTESSISCQGESINTAHYLHVLFRKEMEIESFLQSVIINFWVNLKTIFVLQLKGGWVIGY